MPRLVACCLVGTVATLWAVWPEAVSPAAGSARATDAQVQESTDRTFRLEFSREGRDISGYVYNLTSRYAARMRLRVEGVDAAGKVVTETRTWVPDVPPNSRAFFQVTVADAPAYRIIVESYHWIQEIASSGERWRV